MVGEAVGDVRRRGANGGRAGGRSTCARAPRGTDQRARMRHRIIITALCMDQRSLPCLNVCVPAYDGDPTWRVTASCAGASSRC
jgi:hypothetical protein